MVCDAITFMFAHRMYAVDLITLVAMDTCVNLSYIGNTTRQTDQNHVQKVSRGREGCSKADLCLSGKCMQCTLQMTRFLFMTRVEDTKIYI